MYTKDYDRETSMSNGRTITSSATGTIILLTLHTDTVSVRTFRVWLVAYIATKNTHIILILLTVFKLWVSDSVSNTRRLPCSETAAMHLPSLLTSTVDSLWGLEHKNLCYWFTRSTWNGCLPCVNTDESHWARNPTVCSMWENRPRLI